jgi:hypothetical protein
MTKATKAPTINPSPCHVAAMAREFHELTATTDKLEEQALEKRPGSPTENEIERMLERIGEAHSRIQIAASYSAATSAEGALFQLGQMKSMAIMIGNRGPLCPWDSDASIAQAIERLGYSVANFIRRSQDMQDSDTMEYFFSLDCDPHRANEAITAGLKTQR